MPAYKYYAVKDPNGLVVMRQTRFRGRATEHPHDVMAIAHSVAELKDMMKSVNITEPIDFSGIKESITAKQLVDSLLEASIQESRFTVQLPDGGHMDYGYDRPLQYYFFQVYDKSGEIVASDEMGGCAASDVLDAAEQYGAELPENHQAALFLDVPFPDPDNTGYPGSTATFDTR